MCDKKCASCGEEIDDEEVSLEELESAIVENAIEQLSGGECVVCTINSVFEDGYELGYEAGKKDVAELYKKISEDILSGEF